MKKTLSIYIFYITFGVTLMFSQTKTNQSLGFISLTGTTNINEFKFYNELNNNTVTSFHSTDLNNANEILIHELLLTTNNFVCENDVMKTDFLKLLKSREYPQISITVQQQLSKVLNSTLPTVVPVRLTLAGVEKEYMVQCQLVKNNYDYYLQGEQPVLLSDFHLIAPTKFLGLIRVNEKVIVNFVIKTYNPQDYYNEIQH